MEKKMRALKSNYEKCAACDGDLELLNAATYRTGQACKRCEGLHITCCETDYAVSFKPFYKLVAQPDGADLAYFDISVVDGAGVCVHRVHGWYLADTDFLKNIVQFG